MLGPVAQLGERLVRNQEVRGSIPLRSTKVHLTLKVAESHFNMHRFYCPPSQFNSEQILISDKQELHHLRHVLRMKRNTPIEVFNGEGREATGFLLSISNHKAVIQIDRVKKCEPKIPHFILACAVPKRSKFELIIEKATELNVDEIIPLTTERTEMHLTRDRLAKKHLRYQAVALNASKQSKRILIPKIHPITEFATALEYVIPLGPVIIPSLMEDTQNLLGSFQTIKSSKVISFFIGPEGDFTALEYQQAQETGCLPVTLGKTILKVETAAICTLSCANTFFHT